METETTYLVKVKTLSNDWYVMKVTDSKEEAIDAYFDLMQKYETIITKETILARGRPDGF